MELYLCKKIYNKIVSGRYDQILYVTLVLCIIIDSLWVVESRSRVPVLVSVVAAVVMTGKVECEGGDCNDHHTLLTLPHSFVTHNTTLTQWSCYNTEL